MPAVAAKEPAVRIGLVPADNLSTATHRLDATALDFRTASLRDAPEIWELVSDSGALEENSLYCYLLLCRDFSDTCVVACRGNEIVGFVLAYRPPKSPETVFVWQVGVAEAARGQGLAKRLLRSLVSVPGCDGVRYLEATVTPSNTASRRLFQSFAKALDVPCDIQQGFTADMFGIGDHEEEELFRIGPFDAPAKEDATDDGSL